MNDVRKRVKQFKKAFGLSQIPTDSELRQVVEQLNYKLYTYEDAQKLLQDLGMLEYSNYVPSFTYSKNNDRYIFFSGTLSQNDTLYVLAHEIAHIYLNHLTRHNSYYDTSIYKEQEANYFARLLINPSTFKKPAILGIALALSICAIFISTPKRTDNIPVFIPVQTAAPTTLPKAIPNTENVIITPSGNKYHTPDCWHLKNRQTKTITLNEAIDKGCTPCLDCLITK